MIRTNFYTLLCCLLICISTTAQTSKSTDASEATVKKLAVKNSAALGLKADEARTLRVSSSYYDKNANAVMAYLQQTYKGIDVYNALTIVAFKNGEVVSVQTSNVTDLAKLVSARKSTPGITAVQALKKAAGEVNELLSESTLSTARKSADGQGYEFVREEANSIFVRLMWVPADEDEKTYTLGWQVSLHSEKNNALWLIKIDAQDGKLLKKENLTVECNFNSPAHLQQMECFQNPALNDDNTSGVNEAASVNSAKYKVIPYPFQDPNFTAPVLATNPWTIFADADAYTLLWNSDALKDYDSTRGNNVYAQPDTDGKNATLRDAARSSTALPNLTFNFTPNYNKDPLTSVPNRNFGVTNVFYWNNIMHDMSYQYGFDEVAGNFQQSNLSRGGLGNDYVIADAQDGSGTNNANFAPTVDGSKPRMQMYLWSASPFKSLKVNTPTAFAGFKLATESSVSTNNKIKDKGAITGNIVLYKDADDASLHLACTTPSNGAALAGKIAYIDRGNCDFVSKIKNAQNAGAIAVVLADNVVDTKPIGMGGTDNTITIPAFSILKTTGDSIKTYLNASIAVNITLQPGPAIDGDLDNGVVSHEYTHGISNRLTGGPNNNSCLSNKEPGGMGEGWSDYMGLMVTTNWATAAVGDGFTVPRPIGNYAAGLTPAFGGIRYYPYSTDFNVNPWTYDSLAGSSRFANGTILTYDPHPVGEIWCNMLWTLTWDLIAQDGINATLPNASLPGGNTVALKLVLQGMKLQRCNPGFVDARNGILKADTLLYGGAYSDIIWKAFAKRGLGYSANEKSTNNVKDGIAAYDLPPGVHFIALNTFEVSKQNKSALLTWSAPATVKAGKYIIERSTDGQRFAAIGSIAATGSKGCTYTDNNPATGNNTYRIRSFSSSNSSQLSAERTVKFDGQAAIVIAPNPVRNYLKVTVPGNTQQLQAKIYNTAGGLLHTISFNGSSATVDVRTLAAGSYYIQLTGESINYREKFIVE